MTINWSNNQILSKKRKGTTEDPFLLIEESLPCVNCKIVLTEVPNKQQKVTLNYSEEYSSTKNYIVGDLVYYEIDNIKTTYECIVDCINILPTDTSKWKIIDFIEVSNIKVLEKYEYYVNYLDSIISLNSYFSNKNIICKYYGEGLDFYPSTRIWTKADGTEVTETLQDIISSGQDAIDAALVLKEFEVIEPYDNDKTYKVLNKVTYEGSTYQCILQSQGNLPTNSTYWILIAQKGDQGIQGLQGDIGLKGDKGDKAVNWKNTYNPSTTYIIDDAVSYNGSSYICILASTGNAPTNTTYWDVLAEKGADGSGSGSVTNVSSANEDISIANPTTTPTLTLNSGAGANQIVKRDFNGDIPGDITGNAATVTQDSTHRMVTDTEKSTWNGKQDALTFTPENTENKGQNNGYASLDSTGKVPTTQLPEDIGGGETPFKIKSAFYTSGTDTLSIVIASGTGETFNNTTINTITKTTDTTLNIPSPLASTTYTIYLKNDGNFDKSIDGTTSTGSITIGTVSTNADKSVNTIIDKRPLVSGVGKEFIAHKAETATDAHIISNITGLQTALSDKSPTNHNHSGTYEPVDADIMRKDVPQTMSAILTAQNNTSYTTKQVRNITLSTADASGGSNGDIWFKYV